MKTLSMKLALAAAMVLAATSSASAQGVVPDVKAASMKVLLAVAMLFAAAHSASAQTVIPVIKLADDGFTITLNGLNAPDPIAVAQGAAALNQTFLQAVRGNVLTEVNVNRLVSLSNSGSGNAGIVDVNQEAGNLNNQANLRAIAVLGAEQQLQVLSVSGAQQRVHNQLTVTGGTRETQIVNSFNNTTGVVGVNQSAGNANQQLNQLAVAIGFAAGSDALAVTDVTLGQVSAENKLTETAVGPRRDILQGSFANFSGIAQVSQSSGDLNLVANSISISVVTVGPR